MEHKLPEKSLLESPRFPIEEVNKAAIKEKQGGGRPPYWEMVFWWTRKPLITARAVIAAALLPENFDINQFKRFIRLDPGIVSHKYNPNPQLLPRDLQEKFRKIRLLDPFAGFGSIPLEAIRLGIGEVVAVELLPTAYIFLKAILEYPKRYGERLIKDIERWGKWIIENLKNDPDIRELYDEDVVAYIGTWEIKCPHCGKYTPLVGNWWLARVRKGGSTEDEGEEEGRAMKGVYKRLVWMEPRVIGNEVTIIVRDLNRELNKNEIVAIIDSKQKQNIVKINDKVYTIPEPNVNNRYSRATCLICNNSIKASKGKEWYVKEALKEWNENLEKFLRSEIGLNDLIKSKARPRILAKLRVKGKEVIFEPATKDDFERVFKALEKLRLIWGDPDIPTEPMTEYGGTTLGDPPLIFKHFYKLFTPCQLIVLIKLVKLIRKVGRKIIEELEKSLNENDALQYAEAIATYLAIALCKYVDYNSISNRYRPDKIRFENTFAQRGIAIIWNYVDANPFSKIPGLTGTLVDVVESVIDSVRYLVKSVSNNTSNVKVLLDNASELGKLRGEKFDLIVTDPPYRNDVPYSELSDFYYVWLKRALCDVVNISGLVTRIPRFHKDAFFDEYGNEIEVQWKFFAPYEVSEHGERAKYFRLGDHFNYFKYMLSKSFKTMATKLLDDGSLITYYAHTSPDAWEALLEAGWLSAKMRITATHALTTESGQRVTARGKASLDMSIVVVWRKGVKGEAMASEIYTKAVNICSEECKKYRNMGFDSINLFVATLGCVLSKFTELERIIGIKSIEELVEKYIYPATANAIARAYGASEAKLSTYSMFYFLAKVLISARPRQTRRRMDRNSTVILAIGTRNDIDKLKSLKIVEQDSDNFVLVEPRLRTSDIRGSVADVLRIKGIDPRFPAIRTAVDALHVLEFLVVSLSKDLFRKKFEELKIKYSDQIEEAIELARVLNGALSNNDPEKILTDRLLEALGLKEREGILRYMQTSDERQ